MHRGFLKLHRKLLDWEWYTDNNTKNLFIHLLLKANIEDKKWRGIEIKKGQFLTSLETLKNETGLSIQQTRTALKKLESTNDITNESTNAYRLITLVNYSVYNEIKTDSNKQDNKQSNKRVTEYQQAEQQTSNKQVTGEPTTTKEFNNVNNDKKDNKEKNEKKKDYKQTFESGTFEKLNPEVKELFIEYLEIRDLKKIKSANIEKYIIRTIKEINSYDIDVQIDTLKKSVNGGYQGLFFPKETKQEKNNEIKNQLKNYTEGVEW